MPQIAGGKDIDLDIFISLPQYPMHLDTNNIQWVSGDTLNAVRMFDLMVRNTIVSMS
jgi:hypothetical protein